MAEKDLRIATLMDVAERYWKDGKEWRVAAVAAQAQVTALTTTLTIPARERGPVREPMIAAAVREPSLVAQVIRELAQGDTRLAAYLHQQKRDLRAQYPDMSDEGIAAQLAKWETSEERLDMAVIES